MRGRRRDCATNGNAERLNSTDTAKMSIVKNLAVHTPSRRFQEYHSDSSPFAALNCMLQIRLEILGAIRGTKNSLSFLSIT